MHGPEHGRTLEVRVLRALSEWHKEQRVDRNNREMLAEKVKPSLTLGKYAFKKLRIHKVFGGAPSVESFIRRQFEIKPESRSVWDVIFCWRREHVRDMFYKRRETQR